MGISTGKIAGSIGALLIFAGIFPQISFFGGLPVVGLMLVLVALWDFAGYYKDQAIFNGALLGCVTGVLGVPVMVGVFFFPAMDFVHMIVPSWNGDLASLASISLRDIRTDLTMENIGPYVSTILLALSILFLLSVTITYFWRRSLMELADRTGAALFRTIGALLLIGAIFTVILIGFLLLWIAVFLLAIAFLSINPQKDAAMSRADSKLGLVHIP